MAEVKALKEADEMAEAGERQRLGTSMTQLLLHTFAHLTGPSFRLKAKLLPNKIFLGLM